MLLHYKDSATSGKVVCILHGLFGQSDNWQTHANKLSSYFRVITIDQRNHGHSDWHHEFSYKHLAEDLERLIQHLNIDTFHLIGHSMGGKTAMHYAQLYPNRLEKLIIVDIGIKKYPFHHQEIIEGIRSVKLSNINSRSEAEEAMKPFISSTGVRQFLLKNLYWKEKGQLGWRMNVDVLEAEMDEILSEVPKKEVWIQTLFIRGELSNYILEEDWDEIEQVFPDSELVTIENSGHWVHAEASEVFLEKVLEFLIR